MRRLRARQLAFLPAQQVVAGGLWRRLKAELDKGLEPTLSLEEHVLAAYGAHEEFSPVSRHGDYILEVESQTSGP